MDRTSDIARRRPEESLILLLIAESHTPFLTLAGEPVVPAERISHQCQGSLRTNFVEKEGKDGDAGGSNLPDLAHMLCMRSCEVTPQGLGSIRGMVFAGGLRQVHIHRRIEEYTTTLCILGMPACEAQAPSDTNGRRMGTRV